MDADVVAVAVVVVPIGEITIESERLYDATWRVNPHFKHLRDSRVWRNQARGAIYYKRRARNLRFKQMQTHMYHQMCLNQLRDSSLTSHVIVYRIQPICYMFPCHSYRLLLHPIAMDRPDSGRSTGMKWNTIPSLMSAKHSTILSEYLNRCYPTDQYLGDRSV